MSKNDWVDKLFKWIKYSCWCTLIFGMSKYDWGDKLFKYV